MVKKLNLKTNDFPKKIAELMHSNQFLKMFSVVSMLIVILMLTAMIMLISRPPEIITFDLKGKVIQSTELPDPKVLIEEAIKEYIKHRYEWTPKTVENHLNKAKHFISSKSFRAYEEATLKVISFSTQREVSQKAFPINFKIDIKNQVAKVTGERVTSIQGLKAAGDLKLELHFQSGPHTNANPWGIYISKEVEIL